MNPEPDDGPAQNPIVKLPNRDIRPHPSGNGRDGEPAFHLDETLPEAFGRPMRDDLPEAFGRPPKKNREKSKEDPRKKDTEEEAEPDEKGDEDDQEKGKDDKDKPKKPPFYKRPILMVVVGLLLILAIIVGIIWWLHARQFESTDDAFIDGHVIQISPNVAATVGSVYIDDNWHVKKGDLLVQLDPKDYQVVVDQMRASLVAAKDKFEQAQVQLDVAQANVGEAQAQLLAAQANSENADQDYARIAQLSERARSQQQLDNATATQKTSAAQVEQAKAHLLATQASVGDAAAAVKSAQASIEHADADLQQARINLDYCRITAPEDGMITKKNVEPGMYVDKAQPLFSIVPSNVWVTANYKESQLDLMRVGQPVTIEVDAYSDKVFHGKIDSFQNGTGSRFTLLPPENATGNYVKVVQRIPVKIVLDPGETDDKDHPLALGMSVIPKVKVR